MKSPLKWVGGKSRLADQICNLIPEHKHYAEAFAGAGWVFFRKDPSKFESLNDINGDLVSFYRVLQNHLEEFCKQFKFILSSRETFSEFKEQMEAGGLTDIQRAARFYYLQRHSFGGKVTGRNFGVNVNGYPPINLLRLETELSDVHLRLARVTVENLPWAKYITRYDREETFFYLDPPYYGTEFFYGRGLFTKNDFVELAEILRGVKGKFLLSLNDCKEVRDIFDGFDIITTKTKYTVGGGKKMKTAGEVFIKNY
ncbi:MAG: adenine methyltransferase [Desulfovibrio sp.]|nr:adenine methyltransferase [Desulfovibrio sp.]|tara:strand:+ start:6154 stop:6921 length:768 start_codon:yes stop_codon:yes gene_type:complete